LKKRKNLEGGGHVLKPIWK